MKKRNREKNVYSSKKIRAETETSFNEKVLKEAREEFEIGAQASKEIEKYFGEASDELKSNNRSEKLRLDKKYKRKRANPTLKNPWKRKKTWEHRKKCSDHVSVTKAREKVAMKEIL